MSSEPQSNVQSRLEELGTDPLQVWARARTGLVLVTEEPPQDVQDAHFA